MSVGKKRSKMMRGDQGGLDMCDVKRARKGMAFRKLGLFFLDIDGKPKKLQAAIKKGGDSSQFLGKGATSSDSRERHDHLGPAKKTKEGKGQKQPTATADLGGKKVGVGEGKRGGGPVWRRKGGTPVGGGKKRPRGFKL